MEKLARFGYAAKGVVYFVVGLLAAQVSLTTGGEIINTTGALVTIVKQPFGKFLLILIAMGLAGYVLWRIVQTVFDPDHSNEKMNAKQIVRRIGYGFSAIAYSGLALSAVELITDSEDINGSAIQDWTTRFMAYPFGRWLVGLAGLVMIAVGISYLYQAYKASFQCHFKRYQMSRTEWQWAKILGQFGLAARGIVFGMIGLFLVLAALHSNARAARGLGGVLTMLERQLFGAWMLGTVAFGLIAYSIYCLIEARYRRVTQP
ncbi:DUF1206 domain-containing protein [Microcoleus sp. FACHB-1515]|uniref:DUF1206 domain-containing protein n=1 Tax=Cyanophyceae TaxID=3028117 RepID=UPI001F554382|nr:DUF1206 domain-containing protein [Microcoleus sp. FACHB-1515]